MPRKEENLKYLVYNEMSNGYVVIMGTKAATTTSIPVIPMVTLLLVILLLDEMLPLMGLVAVNKKWNVAANFGNASSQIIKKGYKARILIALMGVSQGTSIINMEEESRTAASLYSSPSPRLPAASKGKLIRSSFRIEEGVLTALLGAAEKRDISLSGLVNKTLKNYTTSEMYLEELGFILVSKTFLRKIFDRLDENEIEELGKEYGLVIAEEYVSYFYSRVNSNTLISFLEIWFRRFQSCQHRIDDNDGDGSDRNKKNKRSHYFTVSHDINMRFSLVLQSILGGLIEPIIKSPVEFRSVTANTITFSFETS